MEVYGAQAGVGVGKPIQYMYSIQDFAGGRVAYRHVFGRWLPVVDDKIIGVEGEVQAVHVREMKKSGQLREFDKSWGADDCHEVLQFAVAIEKVDVNAMLKEGKVPSFFVAAAVKHEMEEGLNYFSAERGLLQSGNSVRSPVTFVTENRPATLKKFGTIIDAWDDEESFLVARFVRRMDDKWEFKRGELRGSTVWEIMMQHLQALEAERAAEVEKLMNAPVDEMDANTFATLFQKKMVEGG